MLFRSPRQRAATSCRVVRQIGHASRRHPHPAPEVGEPSVNRPLCGDLRRNHTAETRMRPGNDPPSPAQPPIRGCGQAKNWADVLSWSIALLRCGNEHSQCGRNWTGKPLSHHAMWTNRGLYRADREGIAVNDANPDLTGPDLTERTDAAVSQIGRAHV